MENYRTEEEQAEALKAWWANYGLFVCVATICGIGSIFGWRHYQDAQKTAAEIASTNHQVMINALQNEETKAAIDAANTLLNEHDSRIYQQFARLNLAAIAVRDDDLKTAETELRQIVKQAKFPPLMMLARLRLVRVLIYADKLPEAEALLAGHDSAYFPATYAELYGDLLRRQNKDSEARDFYTRAMAYVNNADQQDLLRIKLSALTPE